MIPTDIILIHHGEGYHYHREKGIGLCSATTVVVCCVQVVQAVLMQLQTYRASALQKNEGLAPQIYAGGPPKITSNRLFYSIIVNTTMAGMAAAGSFSTLPAGNTLLDRLAPVRF